eukprot:gb/GEZN01010069.1/.p1 GENE.gb/GEZN01010069.1/~~gb/GEZN01010069.1/.p1  ORF type:complete len:355 (+),score=13.65 gb/GEZN01010069.1/:92-1156(+)
MPCFPYNRKKNAADRKSGSGSDQAKSQRRVSVSTSVTSSIFKAIRPARKEVSQRCVAVSSVASSILKAARPAHDEDTTEYRDLVLQLGLELPLWRRLENLHSSDPYAQRCDVNYEGAPPKSPAPFFCRAIIDLPPRKSFSLPVLVVDAYETVMASSSVASACAQVPSLQPALSLEIHETAVVSSVVRLRASAQLPNLQRGGEVDALSDDDIPELEIQCAAAVSNAQLEGYSMDAANHAQLEGILKAACGSSAHTRSPTRHTEKLLILPLESVEEKNRRRGVIMSSAMWGHGNSTSIHSMTSVSSCDSIVTLETNSPVPDDSDSDDESTAKTRRTPGYPKRPIFVVATESQAAEA